MMGRRERKRKELLHDIKEKEKKLEMERENTSLHYLENSFWNVL